MGRPLQLARMEHGAVGTIARFGTTAPLVKFSVEANGGLAAPFHAVRYPPLVGVTTVMLTANALMCGLSAPKSRHRRSPKCGGNGADASRVSTNRCGITGTYSEPMPCAAIT